MTNPGGQLEARFLSRLLDALGSSASPLEFAAPVVAAVADTMGGCCALWLVERPSGALRLAAIHDDDPQRLALVRQLAEEWPSPWPDTVSRQVAALVQPIEFTMGSEEKAIELLGTRDRALLALRAGIASVLLAPLRRRGRRLGLLAIASPDSGSAPDSRNLALATEAAQQLSVALDLLRQIEMFRRSSEELALTSLRLRTILESIPQGVMVMDADNGRVTFANPPLLELIDRPKDTPSGDLTDIDLAGIASPQGEPRSPEDIPWIRSLRSGESTPPEEIVIHRPDGRSATVLCSASPIADESGSVREVVALLQDISDRKEFERQKDEFLAMVAHELRTPLTAIKGYIQFLLRQAKKEPEPRFGEREIQWLEIANRQADRFSRLISQLLDFSRIQTGRLELHPTRFSLSMLARDIVAQQQVAAPDRRWSVLECADDEVEADQDRIEQVITNLISNAIKATGEGSEVAVEVRRDRDYVVASVRDNGRGMPKEARERVFERLYRGPDNSYEGMGLGLYISKGIVDAHGGKIWFESEPGKGSTFYFSLPCGSLR